VTTPELRHDGVSGRLVLVTPGRAARPHTFPASTNTGKPASCPFCPGHESDTPPEVARTGDGAPDRPGWRVRVVPNLYPLVAPDGSEGATGAHEVLVLSPSHNRSFAHLTDEQATEAFTVMRDRARYHLAEGHAFAQASINHGREAGASLVHPHAQLVALDFVPPAVQAALGRFAARGDLVAADAVAGDDNGLTVLEGDVAAWCPLASSSPYQLRIAHCDAGARFDDASDDELGPVALAARDVLARVGASIGDVPYNLVVHTAPPARPGPFHWYLEIVPRTGVMAGFELGTGVHVNVVAPEEAAARLREAAS